MLENGMVPPNMDSRSTRYMRMEKCDAQGRFSFTNIRPNSWIIYTKVTWFAPSSYGLNQQGGVLAKSTTAGPGENRIILSDDDVVKIAQ
jgi:hypothetical protein